MNKLRFICAQPANLYYAWQVEVLLNNFMEVGINLNYVDIVCAIDDVVSNEWNLLRTSYPARFFFYQDTRKSTKYISSIRPNILKQHFKQHPYLKDEVIFYHDCDILITKPPHTWITDEMLSDKNWYGSDTRWYIGYEYIKSKGDDVLSLMTDIVGISVDIVKENELNCIGAQYLLKGVSSYFWERVEFESELLYENVSKLNNSKIQIDRHTVSPEVSRIPYNPLQIWCADMWAVLWNGWKMGKKTITHESFNFTWATSSAKEFYENNIYHNAGVTQKNTELFFKSNYINELPYNKKLVIDKNTASYEYFKMIEKTSKVSVLI